MRRLLMVAFALMPFWALADEFEEQLAQGNALLREGNHQAARDLFQKLETNHPDSAELQFSLGCAEYDRALNVGPDSDPAEVQRGLEAARKAFEKAAALGGKGLRPDAGYNRANAVAQIAKRTPQNDPRTTKQEFERSINAYESFLRQYPDHPQAQQNLDHMRYMLKRLLQQPPPEEQQQGDEQKDKHKQQQESSQGNDQQQQQNQNQQEQGQQGDDEERQDPQDKSEEDPQEGGSQSPQGDNPESQNDPSTTQFQQKAIAGEAPEGKENVEAILESLEERDNGEQHNIRQGPRETRVRKEWW